MNAFKLTLAALAFGAVAAAFADDSTQVYVQTNAAAANQVLVYNADSHGRLSLSGTYETGGQGTGSGLGSQGAVTLSDNGRRLYVVDAGSNDVAVFAVDGRRLRRIGKYSSGGTVPISVTAKGDLVYVLNAGGTGNISGLRSRFDGSLEPIGFSSRALSGASVGPAQIQFTPRGDALVVTEKASNTIDTWPLVWNRPGPLFTTPSAGATPFGFDFDNRGHLLVSEAAGGAPGASSASSYGISFQGWNPISAVVPTNQTAACWLTVTPNGKFAFTANAGSGTVSGYSIARNGELELLTPSGLSGSTGAGSHPVDMTVSDESRYLYVLANGNGTIAEFRIDNNGSLTPIGTVTGLPLSAQGIASR